VGSVLPKLGYQIDVRPITIPDVLTADALMISNTVVGAVAVKSVNQHVYLGYENSFCPIKDELGEHIS
jgi:branched-subunit amino acid aminotransferase/4-amino-4-deoxychorismate lyase